MTATATALRGPEFKGTGAIYLSCPYDSTSAHALSRYPQSKWLKTTKTWCLPRNRSAAELVKRLFPDATTNDEFNALLTKDESE
jgi:hypothetical protein